jgi:Na+-driven multidrug efflux pump
LLSNGAGYASIFVAQYVGAGQPRRVGPAVWQGIHFRLAVNAVLAYAFIFGHWGFLAWGIAGAALATMIGSLASALLALGLMLRPCHNATYQT